MQNRFIQLFILVHILLAISFLTDLPFWILFTISFFLLTVAAIRYGTFDKVLISVTNCLLAIASGILMYGLFLFGKLASEFLFPTQLADVAALYMKIQPHHTWQYVSLFLLIIPGEELFWRGYIQKYVEGKVQNKQLVIIISSFLYTSANIYTLNPLFLLATFAGGVVWGTLYLWKRNIFLVILSHLVFNLFLLVLFPIF